MKHRSHFSICLSKAISASPLPEALTQACCSGLLAEFLQRSLSRHQHFFSAALYFALCICYLINYRGKDSLQSGIVFYIDFPFPIDFPGIHPITLYGTFHVLFLAHTPSENLKPDPSHPCLCTCTLRAALLECHSTSSLGSLQINLPSSAQKPSPISSNLFSHILQSFSPCSH